jgi:hypothetical protein
MLRIAKSARDHPGNGCALRVTQQFSFHFADSEEMPMGAAKVDQKERRARKIRRVSEPDQALKSSSRFHQPP